MTDATPVVTSRLRLVETDPLLTLAALWLGPGDPRMRIEGSTALRTARTTTGPASLRLRCAGHEVHVEAWGPGAETAVAALPELLGERDEPSLLEPRHRLVAELHRRMSGLRMTRTAAVVETLVPTVIAQKVTGLEAKRSYRALLARFGEPAPGPLGRLGLRVPPAAETLAHLPYHVFHAFGLERRRAETVTAAARAAARLEETTRMSAPEARRRLLAVPGVGPWSAAETARLALGDPDAVSVGDYNLPHLVTWALAGRRVGTEEQMLELLEPYRGQRARVVRLIELSAIRPPRHGPRLPARMIASL